MNKVQKKIIKDVVKEYKEHFQNDGWDIDYSFIKSEIVERVLGIDFELALLKELDKLGVSLLVDIIRGKSDRRQRPFIFEILVGFREPIFYNPKTNKLKVGYKRKSKHDEFIGAL